jgi:MFS family permease
MNSFGVFEEIYGVDKAHGGLNVANGNLSTIAWLGAIAVLFFFGISPIAGVLMDIFGPKVSLAIPLQDFIIYIIA